MKKVRVFSSRVVFRGPVFNVMRDQIIEPSGVRATRDIVRHPGSVVVLAIDDTRKEPRVLLERQYRYAANDFLWEIPAGRIDEGETELAAAKRELLEETGYTAALWNRALRYYASPGFMDETMSIYLARKLKKGKAQPEEDESIQVRLVPMSAALRMAANRTIADGKTLLALFWFNHRHRFDQTR